jgi:hypothetical protein
MRDGPSVLIAGLFASGGCPTRAITWVIRWTWAEAMEAHSALSVDLLEEAVE